jgi:hypothetical protein
MPESRSTGSQVDTAPQDSSARTPISRGRARLRESGIACAGSTTRARTRRNAMGKTGRKRRGRKKKAANHGKRPNA